MKKLAVVLAVVLSLSGCEIFKKKEDSHIITTPEVDVAIPVVRKLNVTDIQWKLMDPVVMKQFSESVKDQKIVFYVLDQANMQVMIGNVQELRRYIDQQQAVINYLQAIVNGRSTETK